MIPAQTPEATAAEVFELLEVMANLPYLGEPIDQRAHALQSAALAVEAGADDEVVAAALLHDIARAPAVHLAHPGPHAAAGAAWCRPRFGERVAAIVGAHVDAKRWLVGRDAGYAGTLSEASVRSLARQGGPFTEAEASRFDALPGAADAVAVRRWDDEAKVPGGAEADPERLRATLVRVAAGAGA